MRILLKPGAEDYRTSMIQRCNAAMDACEDDSPVYNHWKKVKRFVLKECGDIEGAKRFSAILSGMDKKKVEEYMDSHMLECCNIESIEFSDVHDMTNGVEGISVYVVMKNGDVYRSEIPTVPEYDINIDRVKGVSQEMREYMEKRIFEDVMRKIRWGRAITEAEYRHWSKRFKELPRK